MLGHWQQFDVGESQRRHVVTQLGGERVPVRDTAAPRPEVHLVGAHRRVAPHRGATPGHPFVVLPGVARPVGDDARVARGQFGLAGHRVGLAQRPTLGRDDLELVPVARPGGRSEARPDSGRAVRVEHRERVGRPVVPVADHRHTRGIRRPHRETHSVGVAVPVDHEALRAEQLPEAPVGALAEQMEIELTDRPSDVGHLVHSRACLRPCAAARGTVPIRVCRSTSQSDLPVRPTGRVPGRASADAVVGLPATGDGRYGGPCRRPRHESRPSRPRGGRPDDRRADHRHGAGAGWPVPRPADRGRPSLAPSRRDGGAHGIGQPWLRQARGDARRPRPVPRRMDSRHRARTRLAHRMGGRHTRHDPQGSIRVDDARNRADAARRPAPARRSHRHQLDRVVARLPGRSIDRAHPVHGRTADHRIRTGRRARGADPQRGRPGALGATRVRRVRTRAARGLVGQRAVREGLPGPGTVDQHRPRLACRTSAA